MNTNVVELDTGLNHATAVLAPAEKLVDGRVCRTASFFAELGCRNSDSSRLQFVYSKRKRMVLEPEGLSSQSPLAEVQCPTNTPIPFGATLTLEYQGSVEFE